MEYFRRVVRDFTQNIFKKTEHDRPAIEVSRADAYLNTLYRILVWEDPVLTWTTLGVLHVLFWFIVNFQIRIYGIIFITVLLVFLTDLYFERNGLQEQRNASSDAIRELVHICNAIFLYLKALRKDNPSMFCVTMCTIFLGLSMLSRNVSGYFLSYLVLLAVFFGPLLISKLPPKYKSSIANAIHAFSTNEGVLAETELIPFLTDKELNEGDAELESLLSDKTADSITNSLISGISSMPSYLEAEGSLDGLEEDDLVPQVRSYVPAAAAEYSSDSDSDHKNMRFDSAHFNGDSSSEDEHNYSKGLRFSEVRDFTDSPGKLDLQAAMTQSLGAGLLSNLAAMGTSLMSNVLKSSPGTVSNVPKQKDSDSDFEFINSDEADEQS